MRLYNLANAFSRIENNDTVLLIDPWLTQGIIEGTWHHYPPMREVDRWLEGVTDIFISHIHEDHFDEEALAGFSKDINIYLPYVFAYQVMEMKLQKMGYKNIVILKPDEELKISDSMSLQMIPPMNEFAQEEEMYQQEKLDDGMPVAIDTGVIVKGIKGEKLVFLVDNSPYSPKAAGACLEVMKGCDLLAFPFNGASQDYPFTYRNYSKEQALKERERCEIKRAELTDKFIDILKPKALMPFSSDFALAGPKAMEFAEVEKHWWGDRGLCTERYAKKHEITSFCLREGDFLEWNEGDVSFTQVDEKVPTLLEVEEKLYFSMEKKFELFPGEFTNIESLKELFTMGAEHIFSRMNQYEIESKWRLKIVIEDIKESFCLNLKDKTVEFDASFEEKEENTVSCFIWSNYLAALLKGKSHWNIAVASFLVEWYRYPDEYDHELFRLINFFHIPRNKMAEFATK